MAKPFGPVVRATETPRVPAWMAALPLNRDEEWVDVLDVTQPRVSPNQWVSEDYATRRIHRLMPVRIHHRTNDGLAVVELRR
jgi:hypothetical protein